MEGALHRSVMLEEVVGFLAPIDGGIYVDGNLGLGGHTEKILELCGPSGKVVAFEWDQEAMALARQRLKQFEQRVYFVADNFANLRKRLADLDIGAIDGLLLDLGLSSYQLDKSERGFSFKGSQPLDMRMDKRSGVTAAQLLNSASEQELADMFFYYGEERQARRIAAFVVEERRLRKIESTAQLVEIIKRAVPKRFRPKKIHSATKVFQALRIAVNTELDNLITVLSHGAEVLKTGAKICVISFHSLEDRIVKHAFQKNPALKALTRKPLLPGEEELKINPRARSAKLRVARKVEVL